MYWQQHGKLFSVKYKGYKIVCSLWLQLYKNTYASEKTEGEIKYRNIGRILDPYFKINVPLFLYNKK